MWCELCNCYEMEIWNEFTNWYWKLYWMKYGNHECVLIVKFCLNGYLNKWPCLVMELSWTLKIWVEMNVIEWNNWIGLNEFMAWHLYGRLLNYVECNIEWFYFAHGKYKDGKVLNWMSINGYGLCSRL